MNVLTEKTITSPIRIGIVTSRFNEHITTRQLQGALDRLEERGIPSDWITAAWVPGAVELTVTLQTMAKTGAFDVLIAFGCIIRGETDHYTFVAEHVTKGCLGLALQENIPVIFGVLTTNNEAQAIDRIGGAKGHIGRECADTALSTLSVNQQIKELYSKTACLT